MRRLRDSAVLHAFRMKRVLAFPHGVRLIAWDERPAPGATPALQYDNSCWLDAAEFVSLIGVCGD